MGFRFSRLYPLEHNLTPLSGEGAMRAQGRFNPAGVFRMLYLAEHPDTALNEVETTAVLNETRVAVGSEPKVMWSVRFDLRAVLDLNRREVREALGLSRQELTGHWQAEAGEGPSPTQLLGLLVRQSGRFDAILYPSARVRDNPGVNLAVLPEKLRGTGGTVEAIPPERGTPEGAVYRLPPR